ncbi:MAG: 23S rRNA (pseudouridine(1915)-N(3))-methyltransferase RlmH [Eubacterium sp.]|nr:23S rRNA (pseudouridine(1915)-N(3))-methyltransferase RlmH [Eubacterium sp.]
MKYEIAARISEKPADYCVGAIAEYAKRLTAYCKIRHQFVRRDSAWKKIIGEKAAGKEVRIRVLPGESRITSEELSRLIGKWESAGMRRILFLIPDPEESLPAEEEPVQSLQWHADFLLPVSSFSMGSDMVTMILYEQIYRGYRILHNQPYHK